jgi:LEA14-like dessication related protein
VTLPEIGLSLNIACVFVAAMRPILLSISVSFALLLTGCSTPPEERLDAPAARVVSLVVGNDTGVLTLSFANPNIVPLVIRSSTHTLTLGDKSMGVIDDAEAIGLPNSGRVDHTVKLPTKVAQAAQAYLSANPGEVRATVKSSLEHVTTGDDTITLKCIGTGLVKAP